MEDVNSLSGLQRMIWTPIASVGWYLVGFGIIALYMFPHIQEKYKSWKTRNQRDDTALAKKTDKLPQLSANVEMARQKMQEVYNKNCALAKEQRDNKEEEEKEKKRQKVLKLLENKNVGTRLGGATDDQTPGTSTKSKLKSEYNPLMGDNTRGYRPAKRTCCKKGGCG